MKLGKDIFQEELNDQTPASVQAPIIDILNRENFDQECVLKPNVKDLWECRYPPSGDTFSYLTNFKSEPRITKQKKYSHYILIGFYSVDIGKYEIYLVKNRSLHKFKITK